jgi:NAD(P)H-dependent FMN reductase
MTDNVIVQPYKQRVVCKLCASEGVKGTVLCNEHLEGYAVACKLLESMHRGQTAKLLWACIQVPKQSPLIVLPNRRG